MKDSWELIKEYYKNNPPAKRREMGEQKWGNHGRRAFVVDQGDVIPVTLGGYGDLRNSEIGIVAHWDSEWPQLYDSQISAEQALEEKRKRCCHLWRWLSHEELECSKCGEIVFSSDEGEC